MSVNLIKGTLGNVQEHIEAKELSDRFVNLSDKAENIYEQSDLKLYKGCGYGGEIYLTDSDKCILAEGVRNIEDYLLTLADDED